MEKKEEKEIIKKEIIDDKKGNDESIPLGKKSIFVKNQKSTVSTNYFMNAKQNKLKNSTFRYSFAKEPDKKNQITSIKKTLNKTLEPNTYKNSIKNNNNNQNKLLKRNSLYLNNNKEANKINIQKNNMVRKSMILNKNNDNKFIKPPDKRKSLVLQKNKNSIRINKDKSNTILEEILEKNEDKKDIPNNENNEENNKQIKNNDYKRAYSRKPTERERQKKLNKLNKNSFGEVEKYTKKAIPFFKRDKKENKNNITNNIKQKNPKLFRTKTNNNFSKIENKIVNNSIKNKNNFQDWSNRNLPEIKKINLKHNHNRITTNLYDKYNNKNKNLLKEKNNKIENRKNNPIFQTITSKFKSLNYKSNIKAKNSNAKMNQKLGFNNKNKKINHTNSIILKPKPSNRGKSALTMRTEKNKISKNYINNNNKKDNNINSIKNKSINKSFNKNQEKEEEKKNINNKNITNLKIKNDENESSEDEDDENDFDIYQMIRSKSCNKRNLNKNSDSDDSEESEEKVSEENDDIESILYGKEQRQIFKNIGEDNFEDTDSVVKYIDFDEVFLTSHNIFSENIEKNNLYSKYIQKFDEIFDKVILKIKEKKSLIIKKSKLDNKEEKETQILNQSEATKDDDSSNKNFN